MGESTTNDICLIIVPKNNARSREGKKKEIFRANLPENNKVSFFNFRFDQLG